MEIVETHSSPKVLRIIARLNVGGPALHCTQLSENLVSRGFKTTLVTGHPGTGEASYEELFEVKTGSYQLIRLEELQRSIKGVSDLKTLWALYRLIRKEKPDIVHTHTAKAGVLGRLAAILAGVPVIVHTFHGHVLSGYFSDFFSKLICILERSLALKTSAIVTLSDALKSELSSKYHVAPADKFQIIPLGRDLEPFYDASKNKGSLRQELKIDNKTLLLGIVGRLVPIKDHQSLFKACATLPKDLNWKLLVVGDGELNTELQALAEQMNLGEHVLFLGWRRDLPRIYADLDLVCLSSLNEGTPLSMIEAFAAGAPVISTDVGGVADLMDGPNLNHPEIPSIKIRNQGILVPPGDSQTLGKGISYLLANPKLREKMSHACQARSRTFTSDALADRMAALYRQLLSVRV